MIETWKDVLGYEGLYQVSNIGRVKSLARFKQTNHSRPTFIKEKFLSIYTNVYPRVQIMKNGTKRKRHVHILVAEAFVENLDNKPNVNHINGIKTDNRASNLEWCTHQENIIHAYRTGLAYNYRGEDTHNSKLTTENVLQIKKFIISGKSNLELSKKYNIDRSVISKIRHGKAWVHVIS